MKQIFLIILSLCLISCQSVEIKKANLNLKKIQREIPPSRIAGKNDIIEYYRDGNLILSIVKSHRKHRGGIWKIEQTIFHNGNKVLVVTETKHETSTKQYRSCMFYGTTDPNILIDLSLDKEKGTIAGVSICSKKQLKIYDIFKFENNFFIPYSAVELKKAHKAIDAILDIVSDLPKGKNANQIMKKVIKYKEEIDNIK
jgi:hypothetical protein